jgi:signal transduction histidine kinase
VETSALTNLVNELEEKSLDITKKQDRDARFSDIHALAVALAHKLRNRLGVIQIAIYNIKQSVSDPQIDSSIGRIERNVLESSRILAGFVAFTRIKMPSYQRTLVYDILEECLETVQKDFKGWEVTLSRKYNRISGCPIDGDPLQLKEVFANLLRNAYEALTERKGEIEVGASFDSACGEMLVRIKDNGAGISAEDLARIREPFFTTKTENAGIGLTSCDKIVDLHGGRIEIESEVEKGTTVTVHLPDRENR